jgi:hypothetical protein
MPVLIASSLKMTAAYLASGGAWHDQRIETCKSAAVHPFARKICRTRRTPSVSVVL